jgi:hypothetical protein
LQISARMGGQSSGSSGTRHSSLVKYNVKNEQEIGLQLQQSAYEPSLKTELRNVHIPMRYLAIRDDF